jgi:hypothetical protein
MDFAEQIEHNMYAHMVGRQIFCPMAKQVLDIKTAVVVEEADGIKTLAILSPEGWERVRREVLAIVPDARIVINGKVQP